jgi:hypothetical protein
MYKQVDKQIPVARLYEKFIIENGHLPKSKVDAMKAEIQ